MAVSYRYVIGPVVEHTFGGLTYYGPPESCVSWIDLRRMSEQSALGQLGCGFFTMPSDWSIPSGYHWLAQSQGPGDCRSLYLTAQDQSAWESLIGVRPTRTASTMVIDALDETLTDLADPTGENAPKPLVPRCPPPGPPAEAEIILGGHSVVRRKQMPSGGRWWNNVSALHRRDVQEIIDRDPSDRLWRKYVGSLAHKYFGRWDDERGNGLIPDAVKKGRAPSRGNGNPLNRRWALMPETTHTESFDGADKSGVGYDLTWSETLAAGLVANTGNVCEFDFTAGAGVSSSCRADADVSGDDHVVTGTLTETSANNALAGMCARFSSSAETYYWGRWNIFSGATQLQKCVTGTLTTLATGSTYCGTLDIEYYAQADGSSISCGCGGSEKTAVTDTAITGHTRGGIRGQSIISNMDTIGVDDWSIADLAAATSYPHGLLPLLGVG